MRTKSLSFGVVGLLAAWSCVAHGAAPADADGRQAAAGHLAAPAPEIEEVIVYGKRIVAGLSEQHLELELREQMRVMKERMKAAITSELKEIAAPRLQLAGADTPFVVDLPQA